MKILFYFKNFKEYLFKKENNYLLILLIIIFFLDRYSKNLIIRNYTNQKYFINDYINLELVWNTGIGFGLLSSSSEVFYLFITSIIGFVIMYLLYIALISNIIDKIIYFIIASGALGNFYDRLTYQAVPDFIDLHYKKFHWFTFNVADIFISLGIISFIIRSFYIKN